MSWAPDPRIAASSLFVADLELCHVRLQDDARWPWLVLLPRVEGATELEHLSPEQRARLIEEVVRAGAAARAAGAALGLAVDKLNTGALGNVVAQLHVHVVGRRRAGDPAGNGPVWGVGEAAPYARDRAEIALNAAAVTLLPSPRRPRT